MDTATQPKQGVLAQHNERKATEPDYYDAVMTAPSITDKTGISDKVLPRTVPTVPANRHQTALVDELAAASGDGIDELTGEELDDAVRDADIPGRSSMSADEKRQALREHAAAR